MSRILAIDYGQKRVGIAVTDELQIIATPLITLHVKEVMNWLSDYFSKEEVEEVVVGKATDMHGNLSDSARVIEPFVKSLQKKFPTLKISRCDERFTSVLAHRAICEAGESHRIRYDKGLVDKVSATLILQTFMQQKQQSKNCL
ncbi:MAG: Holliday junction resolvase RuvX [Bacteroidales bacterium]|nr:Holliday junction resolvase RuvX [Bacteroidales bacterium]